MRGVRACELDASAALGSSCTGLVCPLSRENLPLVVRGQVLIGGLTVGETSLRLRPLLRRIEELVSRRLAQGAVWSMERKFAIGKSHRPGRARSRAFSVSDYVAIANAIRHMGCS